MIVDFEKKNLIILIFMLKYSYEIPPKNSPKIFPPKKSPKKFPKKIHPKNF
jgi:hypothetical protein